MGRQSGALPPVRGGGKGSSGTAPPRIKVFLSHSGRDAQRATRLAAALKEELRPYSGCEQVDVFNTSEPEHRFGGLEARIAAGDAWLPAWETYEEELRAYLSRHLLDSSAYVLLVTPESLSLASRWVEFEIEAAHARALEGHVFIPCVQGGATLAALPRGAKEFQGIALDGHENSDPAEGVRALARAIANPVR